MSELYYLFLCSPNGSADFPPSPDSEDPGSSSLKPFDLLGSEGSTRGENLFIICFSTCHSGIYFFPMCHLSV